MSVDTVRASAPKSNQLNADDLISSPRIIRITAVKSGTSEQPIAVHFDGDDRKPWYPCKTMIRALRCLYTDDAEMWVGQSVELFNDKNVTWAGVKVGGIRISKATGLNSNMSIMVSLNKKTRVPYTIEKLNIAAPVVVQKPVQTGEKLLLDVTSQGFEDTLRMIETGKVTIALVESRRTVSSAAMVEFLKVVPR